MKIKNLKFITLFFIFFSILSVSYAINNEADGWRVPNGSQLEIETSYTHLIVKNNCTKDIFVPTKDKAEFDYFIANRPTCLERWKCKEEIRELNTEIFCAPSTSIFLSWRSVTKNTIGLTYCVFNSSRIVETPIVPIDYGAIIDALKTDISNRLIQANLDIADLQSDFDLGILTDDGIPLRLSSARELSANVNVSYNNEDYNLAVQILDELELLIIQIPFEGDTMEDVKLESDANLPLFIARYNEFKSNYSDTSDLPSYIRTKITNLGIIKNNAESYYNTGIANFMINNETSRNAFISCLDNIDNGNVLITEIKIDMINSNLAKINEAKNEKTIAQTEVDKINEVYSSLQTLLNTAQDKIDDAEYYYSIGWTNTAYRKAKDAIKETDKIPGEIASIANNRINDAENKLSSLWFLYNDEGLNETWIENKLDDCQIEIDIAQNHYDNSDYTDSINAIDGPTFTLLDEVQIDIDDQI